MSFDLEGYYIIEEGFRQDLKRMEDIRKAEVKKEFQDRKMRFNENINTAHHQAKMSGNPNASIEAAKLNEELFNKQVQDEINRRLEEDKRILEAKIYGAEGERAKQAQLAKEFQVKQAEIAANQARDEFNKKAKQEAQASQMKDSQEQMEMFNIAAQNKINTENSEAVSKFNHEAKEALIARVLSGREANALELKNANNNNNSIRR